MVCENESADKVSAHNTTAVMHLLDKEGTPSRWNRAAAIAPRKNIAIFVEMVDVVPEIDGEFTIPT